MVLSLDRTLKKANKAVKKGNTQEAQELFNAILAKYPKNQRALNGIAQLDQLSIPTNIEIKKLNKLIDDGLFAVAAEFALELITHYPKSALLYNILGQAYFNQQKDLDATACFLKATMLRPDYPEAFSNLGAGYRNLQKYDEAAEAYKKSIEIKPNHFAGYNNLAAIYKGAGFHKEAIETYQNMLEHFPEHDEAKVSILHHRAHLCDWSTTQAELDDIQNLGMRPDQTVSTFMMLHLDDDQERHLIRAQNIYKRAGAIPPLPAAEKPAEKRKRIRIGYFSADFYNHATLHLMIRQIELHDPERFEIFIYSFGRQYKDKFRARLIEAVDHFHDVEKLTHQEVAELARKDGLDIAIDLKGYTQDARPEIFSYRAAPVQINYLGYPGTMGADFIDYIVGDRTIIPIEQRHLYSEKIIEIPHTYQINDNTKEISNNGITRADCGLPEEGFVFCSFNSPYKITSQEFDIWMRLLGKIEGSVLWLLKTSDAGVENLKKEAEKRGIDPDRLIFAPKILLAQHLERHKHADLFLDSFLVNAHTTASDALWSGLPIVTKIGKTMISRVAASLLTALDVTELITQTDEEYEALALELASHPDKLQAMRDTINEKRLKSPAFDTELHTRHLEAAYEAAYDKYFNDLDPDHITQEELLELKAKA